MNIRHVWFKTNNTTYELSLIFDTNYKVITITNYEQITNEFATELQATEFFEDKYIQLLRG